jgi:hypothetical protein
MSTGSKDNELSNKYVPGCRWTSEALAAMQEATEAYAVGLLKDTRPDSYSCQAGDHHAQRYAACMVHLRRAYLSMCMGVSLGTAGMVDNIGTAYQSVKTTVVTVQVIAKDVGNGRGGGERKGGPVLLRECVF